MEFKQRVVLGIVAVAGFAYFSAEKIEKDEVSYSTTSEVEILAEKERAEKNFELAENELGEPVKPDEETKGPHPDPDKCICGGTGKYERPDKPGSGDMVDCPYHGNQREEPSLKKEEPQEADVCGCGCNRQGCDCQDGARRSIGIIRK